MNMKRITLSTLGEQPWIAPLSWFGLSLIVAIQELSIGHLNNYIIFKNVFYHVRGLQPLYIEYPDLYTDVNLYGPFFSVIIAPFAMLPDYLGAVLWVMANAGFLYFAIRQLPLTRVQQNLVLLLCSHELMGASSYFQFNPAIAACIILSFSYILKEKDWHAAFFIMLGTFVKVYGIVGLAFFFFSKHRLRLIGGLMMWAVVMFLMPVIFSSINFIVQSYQDWLHALTYKNNKNIQLSNAFNLQNISSIGLIQRVFNLHDLHTAFVIFPALALYAAQYLQLKWRYNQKYQFYILASTLLFTVLFSSSSESPTYIIALPAICIWYLLQPPKPWVHAFFIFALIGTTFSHSDLVTRWVKEQLVVPYALKALPSLLVWIFIIWEILSGRFIRRIYSHEASA